jgi:hypothetical protein
MTQEARVDQPLHLEVQVKCYSQFMLDLSIDPIGTAVNLAALYLAWRGYRSVERGKKKSFRNLRAAWP